MNSWTGIGNLTKDPELRFTQSGTPVCSFSIAINNGKDKEGEDRPPTYIDVTAWDKLGENCAEYLRKGKKCAVVGPINVEDYEKDGVKRRSYKIRAFSVEFLSPREEGETTTKTKRAAPQDDLKDLPW